MNYPFEPRSTKHLEHGQFWGIPLRSGRYAAGAVLALATRQGKRDTRMVCIGLLDWVGESPPVADDIAHAEIIEHGFAHVRSIQRNGSLIRGRVQRNWGIEPELDFLRWAGSGISVWGLSVIHHSAELRWGDAAWVKEQLASQWATLVGSKAGA